MFVIKFMLYADESFRQALFGKKSRDLVTLPCHVCGKAFSRRKNDLQWSAAKGVTHVVCSTSCGAKTQATTCDCVCAYCGVVVSKSKSARQKSKSGNSFCSKSCAAKFNNSHKTHGTRRSKLERWLEARLIESYPQLDFVFNSKTDISSELDIYIPSLRLAFELNGIFHYEPIFGDSKLDAIQENDTRKFKACAEAGISLCILDTSSQKRFTEKSSEQFLTIINTIIHGRLAE